MAPDVVAGLRVSKCAVGPDRCRTFTVVSSGEDLEREVSVPRGIARSQDALCRRGVTGCCVGAFGHARLCTVD